MLLYTLISYPLLVVGISKLSAIYLQCNTLIDLFIHYLYDVLECVFLTALRCRGKREKEIKEHRSSRYESKNLTSHKWQNDQESFPGGIVEDSPTATIGLQTISGNG